MWINQEILQKVLLWSKFPITYSWKNIVLEFDVKVTTKSLSMKYLPDENSSRLKIINDLHVQGLTDVQISNYLNDKGIKTPKGKKYYYELVWVTRNKSNKRNDRSYERKIELTKLNIYY